ncbi:hypothetical protein AJ78_05125 [Emergomyces pasteurianus Ep9510]|uniref:Uncharacterized protein n=1 Tax=Emergomyces pasteurianus Ep9510 TaxID=1447872 RepID=A0A1J9PD85_9EURO|nr:hypothetical protein AJ78_05125 [Emergomyces pasteurianus Ep9510]
MSSMASAHPTPISAPGALAAANEKFWTTSADTVFNEPWVQAFNTKMRAFLEKNLDWLGIVDDRTSAAEVAEKKMLDYACGDGFLTRVYHPFFTKCIGIDIAAGMVKKFNETAAQLGLAPEKMYAVKGDLSTSAPELLKEEGVTAPDLSGDEFFNFDFAGVALALHHMEDPQTTIVKMADRLKSGGVILVIDLLKSEGLQESKTGEENGGHQHHPHQCDHHHGHSHGHGHDPLDIATATGHPGPAGHTISPDHASFSPEVVRNMFARAGLTDIEMIFSDWKLELLFVTDPNAKVFVARGRKP